MTTRLRHALGLWLGLTGAAQAATYGVLVRWQPTAAPDVAGYHVWVRPVGAGYGAALDARLPTPAADGTLGFAASGLTVGTDYAVAVSAYTTSGAESARSNELVVHSPATATTTTTRPPSTTSTISTPPRATTSTTAPPLATTCAATACPDPGPCHRLACDRLGTCTDEPVPDGSPCDAGDPCAGGVCAAGACNPTPQADTAPPRTLAVGRFVLRTVGRARRLVARGAFATTAPLDPSTSGLVLELQAPDGSVLYRAALDGSAFRSSRSRRRFRYAVAPGWPPPPGARGLRRVVVHVDGLAARVLVVGRDVALARAAAEPRLGWVVRAGTECARDLGLACTLEDPGLTRCE